jgi:hypothetical protein
MAEMVFKAPWAKSLLIITSLTTLLMMVLILLGLFAGPGPRSSPLWLGAMVGLPLVLLVGTALYGIKGYVLQDQVLHVQHPGWTTSIDLQQLVSAEFDSEAMNNSIRLWGNGGVFSFTGRFRNRKLGQYDVYATDPRRSVVLKLPRKTVVVTPDQPERFVQAILEAKQ